MAGLKSVPRGEDGEVPEGSLLGKLHKLDGKIETLTEQIDNLLTERSQLLDYCDLSEMEWEMAKNSGKTAEKESRLQSYLKKLEVDLDSILSKIPISAR